MEFHYYFLIQELIGALLVFINFRLAITCLRLMIRNGIKISSLALLLHYVLLIIAGVWLLLNEFAISTWRVSLGFIAVALVIIMMLKMRHKDK